MTAVLAIGTLALVCAAPRTTFAQAGGAPGSTAFRPLDPKEIAARKKDADGRAFVDECNNRAGM